jgi:hypothetical protein
MRFRPSLRAGGGCGQVRAVPLLCGVAVVSLVVPFASADAQTVERVDAEAVHYQPPVDGLIDDPFRPPPQPWMAGNRGIDYATAPGTPVRAAADGEVVFAGAVGGSLHVTVSHADGHRSSYAFLATVSVASGAPVVAGQVLGTTAGRFHFGIRDAQGTYLNPLAFVGAPAARLVPGGDDGAVAAAGDELTGLLRQFLLDGLGAAGGDVVPDLGAVLAALGHYGQALGAGGNSRAALAALVASVGEQGPCTDPATAVPSPPGRRIMVLVAGFGSSSGPMGVDAVDASSLGYAPDDVLRLSYRGGRTPPPTGTSGTGALRGLRVSDYSARDALGDLPTAAQHLVDLLADVAAAAPGVPIDVVAHSQGGVVARLALAGAGEERNLAAEVANLVTLGSPHHGADLATAGAALAGTWRGAAAFGLAEAAGLPVSGSSSAMAQLSETSAVSASPGGAGGGTTLPPGVRFTSVAARGDLVVPMPRTQAPGAATATVSLVGISAHDDLPGAPATTREIGLAVAGLPPTCRSRADSIADVVVGHSVAGAQDSLGAALLGLSLVP